jgi:hypothetical protein
MKIANNYPVHAYIHLLIVGYSGVVESLLNTNNLQNNSDKSPTGDVVRC